MALTNEEVDQKLAQALDFIHATRTPNDGGATAATVEALKDILVDNPQISQQLADRVNQKLAPK